MFRVAIGRAFLYWLLIIPALSLQGSASLPSKAQPEATAQPGKALIVAGLKGRVMVRHDGRGVPYIEAGNEADLYLAQGYLTARDRLWQMDLLRRTGRGEMSEIFGRATLEQDKVRRAYGFAAVSEELAGTLAAPVRAQFEAYAAGVNAYIESCDEKSLPAEFRTLQYRPRPWTPADSLVIGKLLAEALSSSWQLDLMRASRSDLPRELRELLNNKQSQWDVPIVGSDSPGKKASLVLEHSYDSTRSYRLHQDLIPSPWVLEQATSIREVIAGSLRRAGLFSSELAASNNWVISGKRTLSGKPLLANDPHLDPSAPSIWYLTHLSTKDMRVAGVTFPGVPGIIIGHNDRIAWGMTNLGADVQDLYVETFDEQKPQRYLTPGGWRQADTRHEIIKVRKAFNDPTVETVAYDVTSTHHGPVIFKQGSKQYALRWVALDTRASEFSAFYAINRSRNWKEFRAALKGFSGPSQNFVYADVDGHIGYYGAGRIPIRRVGDGSLPYEGAKDAGDWIGYIPFESLPHLFDPPSGIIVTANNRIVGLDYPHHLTHDWAPPYRARRILDLLQALPKLTAEDFLRVQSDTYSISGSAFAREIIKAGRAGAKGASDPGLSLTIEALEKWDGQLKAESTVPPLLSETRAALRRRVLTPVLGQARAEQASRDIGSTFIDHLLIRQPKEWLPEEFGSYAELLQACERDAREALAKRFGQDPSEWRWGRIAIARFMHPLAISPLAGSKFAIPAFPFNGSNGTFPTVNVGSSVSMRFIADPADWDRTRQGIALGQSGDPQSRHWIDQLNDWKAVTTQIFPFTKEAILSAQKELLELAPISR